MVFGIVGIQRDVCSGDGGRPAALSVDISEIQAVELIEKSHSAGSASGFKTDTRFTGEPGGVIERFVTAGPIQAIGSIGRDKDFRSRAFGNQVECIEAGLTIAVGNVAFLIGVGGSKLGGFGDAVGGDQREVFTAGSKLKISVKFSGRGGLAVFSGSKNDDPLA